MKTTVFLGAGASKAVGYPVTSEILSEIRRRLKGDTTMFGSSVPNRAAAVRLKALMLRLMPGFRDESLKLPLVTDVLSLLDHALVTGNALLPKKSPSDLAQFRELLERAIASVIETDELYTEDEQRILDTFSEWLASRVGEGNGGIVSTNYDISVERELFWEYETHREVSEHFDFGIRWRDPDSNTPRLYAPPVNPGWRVYKLHGSLNWLRCRCCEHIYINTKGSIHKLSAERVTDFNTCHCGHAPLSTVLVAPSLIRDIRDPNLIAFGPTLWN